MTTLADLRARAERIQQEFEEARSALFSSDGAPKLGPSLHGERLATLESERAEKLDTVLEEVGELVAGAELEIADFETGDFTRLLSAEEIASATARKEFIGDDVRSASEGELVGKLRTILASGDRPGIFCYWRSASARSADLSNMELDEILIDMRNHLAGATRVAAVERARNTLGEAEAAQMFVSRLRNTGTRTASDAWFNRRVRSVG